MSLSLSRALLLIILAFIAGFWTATHLGKALEWSGRFGDYVVRLVDRTPRCPDNFTCQPRP